MSGHGATASNGHDHERSDAQTRPVFRLVVGLAVMVAAAMVLMAAMYSYLGRREAALDTSLSPLAGESPAVTPEPRLQPNPPTDLAKMRAAEAAQLNSYGWVDQREGLVHIPIERAMELMAERGLPARAQPPKQP